LFGFYSGRAAPKLNANQPTQAIYHTDLQKSPRRQCEICAILRFDLKADRTPFFPLSKLRCWVEVSKSDNVQTNLCNKAGFRQLLECHRHPYYESLKATTTQVHKQRYTNQKQKVEEKRETYSPSLGAHVGIVRICHYL